MTLKAAKAVSTPLGDLHCVVTEATATNRLGSSTLRSFFNSKYGFARLEYRNIDSSEINLDLARVVEP